MKMTYSINGTFIVVVILLLFLFMKLSFLCWSEVPYMFVITEIKKSELDLPLAIG